jgi:hypothetical protein
VLQSKANVLSKVDRPDVVGRWVNGGRKSWPTVQDLGPFVIAWKKWWMSLQPASRIQRGKTPLLRSMEIDEGWEDLMKGGINGFFNVVVSLVWWFQAIKTAAQRKVFTDMMEDVLWVTGQMISKLQGVKKRTRLDSIVKDVPERAKR